MEVFQGGICGPSALLQDSCLDQQDPSDVYPHSQAILGEGDCEGLSLPCYRRLVVLGLARTGVSLERGQNSKKEVLQG